VSRELLQTIPLPPGVKSESERREKKEIKLKELYRDF
jgi:hypothetical protein